MSIAARSRACSVVSMAAILAMASMAAMAANAVVPCALAAEALTPEQVQAARTSFKEGLELEKKADYEGALAKFQATAAIKATPQVEFHVALCEAKLHRYVAALADLRKAETDAKEAKVAEVAEAAPKLAAEIEPLVPKVTIAVSAGTAASLAIDGASVDVAKIGTPIPLDPGAHSIAAKDADGNEKKVDVDLAEKDDKQVTIAFEAGAAKTPETSEPLPPPPVLPDEDKPAPSRDPMATRRTIGWIVGGAGVASLGVSLAFLLMRNSKVSSLDAQCVDMKCPPTASDDLDAAKTDVTISRIALGVGLVSLGVGAYLLVTSRPRSESPPPTGVSFVPAAPGALVGAGFQGVF